MKRTAIYVLTAALGIVFVAPLASAQSWGDMQADHGSIHHEQAQIRHDRHEQRKDLKHGDYGAAREEQGEITRVGNRWVSSNGTFTTIGLSATGATIMKTATGTSAFL